MQEDGGRRYGLAVMDQSLDIYDFTIDFLRKRTEPGRLIMKNKTEFDPFP